jgi:hypothetical protein
MASMNATAFAQHIQARDHIALERLDITKQYGILLVLANVDKHAVQATEPTLLCVAGFSSGIY